MNGLNTNGVSLSLSLTEERFLWLLVSLFLPAGIPEGGSARFAAR